MRRRFRNGAGVKGSVKTVKDSSPASKRLEKVRGLEKGNQGHSSKLKFEGYGTAELIDQEEEAL
jgi:hypothetical protein